MQANRIQKIYVNMCAMMKQKVKRSMDCAGKLITKNMQTAHTEDHLLTPKADNKEGLQVFVLKAEVYPPSYFFPSLLASEEKQ